MNKIAHIQRMNRQELERGMVYLDRNYRGGSWHEKYLASAWVYVGGLSEKLSEGDVVCILSEFGEVEDVNLVRAEDTGKSRGFAFLKYEDSRSCVLAVDNLTGTKVLGRTLCCDHVEEYRLPKHLKDRQDGDEQEKDVKWEVGHAYKGQELASNYDLNTGQDLFAPIVESKTTNVGTSNLLLEEKVENNITKKYDLIPDIDYDEYLNQAKSERAVSSTLGEKKSKKKEKRHRLKKEEKKARKESKRSKNESDSSRKRQYSSDEYKEYDGGRLDKSQKQIRRQRHDHYDGSSSDDDRHNRMQRIRRDVNRESRTHRQRHDSETE